MLGVCCCHQAFSCYGKQGLPSSCGVQASHCGFSCFGARALVRTGFSSCGSWVLERRLNSCGTRACWLHGTLNTLGSRIKAASPALVGAFFTTEPSGKPHTTHFKMILTSMRWVTQLASGGAEIQLRSIYRAFFTIQHWLFLSLPCAFDLQWEENCLNLC